MKFKIILAALALAAFLPTAQAATSDKSNEAAAAASSDAWPGHEVESADDVVATTCETCRGANTAVERKFQTLEQKRELAAHPAAKPSDGTAQ